MQNKSNINSGNLDLSNSSLEEKIIIKADKNETNSRLDKFLSLKINQSRSFVQNLIKNNKIFNSCVLDVPLTNSYKIKNNDEFIVYIEKAKEYDIAPQDISLDIIFEDDDILVINKQPGLVVHPCDSCKDNTLVNAILFHCKDNLSGINGIKRPGILHRLDKDTSGIIVIAKNDFTHNFIAKQFSERKDYLKKTYLAIVSGIPVNKKGVIETYIARDKNNRKKMANYKSQSDNNKYAKTLYNVVDSYKINDKDDYISLIRLELCTGRTHQIRLHMHYINHPIIGDVLYFNNKQKYLTKILDVKRQALHAYCLSFMHPRTKNILTLKAPLAKDMLNLVQNTKILI